MWLVYELTFMPDKSLSDDDKELLKQEYDNIFAQIEHWDNQFWTKSRFFLLIESAFLGGGLQVIGSNIVSGTNFSTLFILLGIFLALFNIFLSYVWFRAIRRNREYIEPRVERARRIEQLIGSDVAWRSFIEQDKHLSPKGSSNWELKLPLSFLFVWFCVGILLWWQISWIGTTVWVLGLVTGAVYFEHGMWFSKKETRNYDPDLD